MARKLIVEILGDSSSLERSFNKSTVAANKFGRNVDTVGGRLDTTAKKFSRFQSAFVGGLAFTAAAQGIRTVVNAAAESQQVLGQTSVALDATGNSWAQYGKQIEQVVKAQSRLGFDDEELLKTFSLFVRTTGDVNKALRLNALATDVARGRYIDLEQAATLVNKAAIGQSGALRRLGIDVRKGASAQELLTALTEKYGDAAQRASGDAATAMARFDVEVQNLEESMGTLLLPAVTALVGTIADLAQTTSVAIGKLQALGKIKIPPIHIPIVGDFGGGDTGFLGGFGKRVGLNFAENLPAIGGIVKAIEIQMAKAREEAAQAAKLAAAKESTRLAKEFSDSVGGMFKSAIDQATAGGINVTPAPIDVNFTDLLFNVGIKGFATGATPSDILGPLIKQLPNKFTEGILNAEISGQGLRDAHLAARDKILDALKDPRLKAKDRIALKQALKAENDAIKSIDDGIAQGIRDANAKRADRLKKIADANKAAAEKHREQLRKIAEARRKAAEQAAKQLQTRQFRAIGLGPEGDEIVPRVANLRKQFEQLGKNIEPGQLSSKMRKQLAGVGKLLRGDLGKLTEATREKIRDLFRTIRSEFDKGATDALKINPRTTAINKNAIVAGLGLDRDTERTIRARLSGINRAGRRLAPTPGTTGAFGITITPQPIHVNTTVNLDGQKVARNTTIHQQKNKRSNPAQKRGPLRGI